jgi:raffinose/stachyose/melibiose transport system permease protein
MVTTKGFSISQFFKFLSLIGLSALVLLPVAHVIISSFKTTAEISRLDLFPSTLYYENYVKVFNNPYTIFGFVNSFIIASTSIVIIVFVTSLASYGIARRREKMFSFFYALFLLAMIIPAASTMVPLYKLISDLRLVDNRLSLILIYSASGIPMGILLYSSFIKTVPVSLDESAVIEGCGYLSRFYLIVFPLVRSITATLIILRLPAIWNDFMMPLLFIRDNWKKPITLVVYTFIWEYNQDFGAIFALLVLVMIPPIVFFLIGQKHIYKSITAGAVKS